MDYDEQVVTVKMSSQFENVRTGAYYRSADMHATGGTYQVRFFVFCIIYVGTSRFVYVIYVLLI